MNVPKCTRFEFLNLNMKVKDVDELDENWRAKLLCQHASMHQNWRFEALLFVPGVASDGRTDEWTSCTTISLSHNGVTNRTDGRMDERAQTKKS